MEITLLALHGVRRRLEREKFNYYCELCQCDEVQEEYWDWWQRDPIGFFSHVKNLREPILLELVQWSKEF